MDFLDPKKQRRHQIILLIGYGLIAIAIAMTTLLLLYQVNGFGVDKEGQVIQSGLVFISSQPTNAAIYVNGELNKSRSDTRLSLPSGTYTIKVTAAGYRDWQHQVVVNGGDVQHYDYPYLFPTVLKTKTVTALSHVPDFSTQSPDHRWLIEKVAGSVPDLTEYDMKNPSLPVASTLSLPADVATTGIGADQWTATEWSNDNKHVLLRHNYVAADGSVAAEYIVLDRDNPADSVNLTKTLVLPPSETLSLFNKHWNQYYAFDASAQTLRTTSLDNSIAVQKLEHITSFKSYGDNTLMYVTDQPPSGKTTAGMVSVVLQQGQKTWILHTLPAGAPTYSLDVSQYAGDWYMVMAASTDNVVYIYKNPQNQNSVTKDVPAPWRRLQLNHPSHVSFSSTAQFILAESGQQFIIYDTENVRVVRYTTKEPIDTPQTFASWLDGSHLTYVSGGQELVFDYDYQNVQTLQAALPAYLPAFDSSYRYVYSVAADTITPDAAVLTSTPLVVVK